VSQATAEIYQYLLSKPRIIQKEAVILDPYDRKVSTISGFNHRRFIIPMPIANTVPVINKILCLQI
jgi:hypothetical protein